MIVSPVHFPIYNFTSHRAGGDDVFDRSFSFGRGSWALAFGLMAIAKKRGAKSVRVWFPDYFCKEPLDVLSLFPVSIAFYPVQKNLQPDWQECEVRCQKESPPDAFVLVHYFGFANNCEAARAFCARHEIELVEDCAHVMRPYKAMGSTGVCALFSPWKFYPVPLLGLLLVQNDLHSFVEQVSPRWEIRSLFTWWLKREVQRMRCLFGIGWYRRVSTRSSKNAQSMGAANLLALRILRHCQGLPADAIAKRRVQNYRSLEQFFFTRYPQMLLFGQLANGIIPYAFPFVSKTPAKTLVSALVDRGIPATLWPALPDPVVRDRERYPWARFYADHLVLLPVHQNVSARNIEYMKSVLALIW